jgi:predicted Rossmann-fold nucleotide-binding protein
LGIGLKKDSFNVWGDNIGLIWSVSTFAFLRGSQVLGIIPKALGKENIIRKTIREGLKVLIMSERITTMVKYLDAFISLLGGLGTL